MPKPHPSALRLLLHRLASLALGGLLSASALQATAADRSDRLTDAERRAAVETIAALVAENYVFPEVGAKTAARLRARLEENAYAAVDTLPAFAEALTRDLRDATHDRHFEVIAREPGHAPIGGDDPKDRERRFEGARRSNFGFERAELLSGNVGYLKLNGFLPADVAGSTAVAAMNFLAYSEALIVDLRDNGGGDPSMIQLLSTYFFNEPTHLNDLYWRKGDRRDQFWTLPFAPGPRLAAAPLFVLTSARTFSAAEEFAYNLKTLKRATIVGERTGGGANPGDGFPVGERLHIFIPTGRAINPQTGGNWEGTGVEPDVAVAAGDAPASAHIEALRRLEAQSQDPRRIASLRFFRAGIEARLRPAQIAAARLPAFVGDFGPRRITLEAGTLYYQRQGRPKVRLEPLTDDTFALQGVDSFRLRFVAGSAGEIVKLIGMYDDGREEENVRNP